MELCDDRVVGSSLGRFGGVGPDPEREAALAGNRSAWAVSVSRDRE